MELLDGRTRRLIARLDAGDPLWEPVVGVQFSPDSRVLAAQTYEDSPAYPFNRLLRWDARTGAQIGDVRRIPGRAPSLLGFVAARRLVTSSAQDHATVIRDAATLRPVRRFGVAGTVAAIDRGAGTIAFGSRSGSVRLLDIRSGRVRTAAGGHDGAVTAIGFSADGRRLVTAGRDERMIVWDVARARATESLDARGRGPATGVMIGRDARTAYSAGATGPSSPGTWRAAAASSVPSRRASGRSGRARSAWRCAARRSRSRTRTATSRCSTAARGSGSAGSRSAAAAVPPSRCPRTGARLQP